MVGNLLIIGDSYSTYKGCIPEGYAPYYSITGEEPTHPVSAMKMEETWWYKFREMTGANIVQNNSWSGSPICYVGYDGKDCSKSSSFLYRFRKLRDEGFFTENKIDTVIVFGGTNDSWIGVPLGEEKYSDFKEEEFYTVLPAICCLMTEMAHDLLPETRVLVVANCGIKDEIINCFKNGGERLGLQVHCLHDIDKSDGHPTPLGMTQIAEQIEKALSTQGC